MEAEKIIDMKLYNSDCLVGMYALHGPDSDTQWIADLIASGDVHAFYTSVKWERTRAEVLALDHHECQYCKERGRYRRARLVHHVNHLRDRPDLALSIWYTDTQGVKRRQLVSCCWDCHEAQHPERLRRKRRKPPLTPERW